MSAKPGSCQKIDEAVWFSQSLYLVRVRVRVGVGVGVRVRVKLGLGSVG